MTNVLEGFVDVEGGRTWYRVAGAEKKGTPLIALHGGPGLNHEYLKPLEALADERPVIFYDQLGGGNSPAPDNPRLWTTESFVEELARVRAALGLEKVFILGQSWGTMLAVDYMLTRKPEGVAGMILSGPCLSAAQWAADQKVYIEELPEDIRKIIAHSETSGDFTSQNYQNAMLSFYKLHVCRLDPWPEFLSKSIEKLKFAIYLHMWGPSEFTVTGTLKGYDRVGRLGEIQTPVLFTCGRFDEASPAATAIYHQALPGSEMRIFEDASHSHHIEKADEYMLAARDFIKRQEEKVSKNL
ncbi:MAG: proline iminopeptidase-family hydrolase [Elusimicrobiota bacterium]